MIFIIKSIKQLYDFVRPSDRVKIQEINNIKQLYDFVRPSDRVKIQEINNILSK